MMASDNGNMKIVRLLIDEEAQVDFQNKEDGHTAVTYALSKKPPRWMDENWRQELLTNRSEIYKLFIKHYNQFDILLNEDFDKPIIWAARNGYHSTVEGLIKYFKANVDELDKYENTPIIWASRYGHLEVVRVLIEHGASVNVQDRFKNTALIEAARHGFLEIVELILSTSNEFLNAQNPQGFTPLMYAAQNWYPEIALILLEKGALTDEPNIIGETALTIFSKFG